MKKALIFILCLLLKPLFVNAGYITIVGSPRLSVTVDSNQVTIKGTISLRNNGDEKAIDVFPMLQINSWSWAGKSTEIEPGGQNRWTISEENISTEMLSISSDLAKDDLNIPFRGMYPLRILRYYRDQNGYQFSSPGMQTLVIGQLSNAEQAERGKLTFQTKATLREKGQRFPGTLTIKNLSDQDQDIWLSFHTSHNLEIENEPALIHVPARKTEEIRINTKNFSGLIGSRYDVFPILQWQQGSIRNTNYLRSSVLIAEDERSNWFLYGAAILLVVGIVIVMIFLKRMRKK